MSTSPTPPLSAGSIRVALLELKFAVHTLPVASIDTPVWPVPVGVFTNPTRLPSLARCTTRQLLLQKRELLIQTCPLLSVARPWAFWCWANVPISVPFGANFRTPLLPSVETHTLPVGSMATP